MWRRRSGFCHLNMRYHQNRQADMGATPVEEAVLTCTKTGRALTESEQCDTCTLSLVTYPQHITGCLILGCSVSAASLAMDTLSSELWQIPSGEEQLQFGHVCDHKTPESPDVRSLSKHGVPSCPHTVCLSKSHALLEGS